MLEPEQKNPMFAVYDQQSRGRAFAHSASENGGGKVCHGSGGITIRPHSGYTALLRLLQVGVEQRDAAE
jgi:hypothetical protein